MFIIMASEKNTDAQIVSHKNRNETYDGVMECVLKHIKQKQTHLKTEKININAFQDETSKRHIRP